MTSVLVTGAGGRLGADLRAAAAGIAVQVTGLTRAELDVTDPTAVRLVLADVRPDVLVNAAAYTAVDAAEADAAAAYAANAVAPAVLAAALAERGGRLLHVSTDYVFAGDAAVPYQVDDPSGPRSVYGRSKLAGERAVRRLLPGRSWVVRTGWLYGARTGFVGTMARLAVAGGTVDVVDDQRGAPTWSRQLAAGLLVLAGSAAPAGVYHCTSAGETTWFEVARAVFAELGADPARVRPTSTDRLGRPAPRPAYSVLSDAAWRAAGLPPLPPWRDALRAALASPDAGARPDT